MALQFYRACIEADDQPGYSVFFPDFPGCTSAGDTVQEAARNAAEALALHVEGLIDAGKAIPQPSAPDAPLPDWLEASEHDEAPSKIAATVLVPVEAPGRTVRVNITMDEGLLGRLDAAASAAGTSRSGFIAEVVRERIARARSAA